MKIIGLDDKEYTWNIHRYNKQRKNCSQYHLRARNLLAEMYPFDIIYEEVTLPGTKSERFPRSLVADFYIHRERILIEVQGEQHYKFNSFMYKNNLEFLKAVSRDAMKVLWCEINNIYYIAFPYNEADEEWKERIYNR